MIDLTIHFLTDIHLWVLCIETTVGGCQVNVFVITLCFVYVLATIKYEQPF